MSIDYQLVAKEFVVQCAQEFTDELLLPFQMQAIQRLCIFLEGVERVPADEFSAITLNEFRNRFILVCDAMREEFSAKSAVYMWN